MLNLNLGRSGRGRPRRSPNKHVTTRSGRVLKVNRSMGERLTAMKEAKDLRKVNRMRGLPKSRLKRFLWRLQPDHLAEFWFSRDGGITALKITGIAILVIFILTVGVFAFFRRDLPDLKNDVYGSKLGGSISYYDRTGQALLFQDYDAVKRVPVASKDISQYLKDATVAVEDKDFYSHRGFDLKGIARAAFNDIFHRNSLQGGSTIDQQLVKLNENWTNQRSIARKIKEVILAVELERTYTKDEILTGYLNAAPYGGVDYGAQTAASDYFRKPAKDLNLAEATFLASVPKSPSYYSPYSQNFDRPALLGRQHYVLDLMVNQHKITKAQADDAKKVDVLAEIQPQQTKFAGIRAPYFVLAAKDELKSEFVPTGGSNSAKIGGWKVITTLNLDFQNKAEDIVAKNVPNIRGYGADEAALDMQDVKTGQMLAMVGGVDFTDPDHGQLNYGHSVRIAPGSSVKPYDYTTLIDNNSNVGAGSVIFDSQGALPGYLCTNKNHPFNHGVPTGGNCLWDYDFTYPGPLSLRYALGGSRNVPAVKAMLMAKPNDTSPEHVDSVNKVINTMDDLMASPNAYQCYKPGVDINNATSADQDQCHGASGIGDGAYLHLDQHVNGLASLARMGQAIPFTYILQIQDASGKTIYQWKQPKPTQVVKPESAYIVDDMTSDGNASYLPAGYYKWHNYNGWRTSIKTGTSNEGFDGLMMSWNTQFAIGSWAGYHNRNRTLGGTMELLTTPMTKGLMTYALDSLHQKPVNYTEPAGIQHLPAFVVTNHIHYGDVEPSPSAELYPSWYKGPTGSTASVTMDKVSNKQATDCTPPLAKQTSGGNTSANRFSIDIFYGGGGSPSGGSSANTAANDDVHQCSDQKPAITLTSTDNKDGSFNLTATATAGTHPFNDPTYPQYPGTINFIIDGNTVKSFTDLSDSPATRSFTYTASSGSHTATAQVIDSVLYDATSDPVTLSFSQPQQPPPGNNQITDFTITVSGNVNKKTNFSWTGGTAPYSVYKNGGTPICNSVNDDNCSVPYAQAPSSTSVYVQDSGGNKASGTVP